MSRALFAIAGLVLLVASSVVLVKQVRAHGVRGVISRVGHEASVTDPKNDLVRAGHQLEVEHAVKGTFTRTDLSKYKNVLLAYATETRYCIQLVKDRQVYHLSGPDGVADTGGCYSS